MQQRVNAVVTKAVNYRDNDRVLTLVTREQGVLTVSARNCRAAKSKLLSCAQPFCYGEYELTTLLGQQVVKACEVKQIFYELRLDPSAMAAAAYCCALSQKLAMPGEPFLKGFSLLLHTLKALCAPGVNVDGVLAFFVGKSLAFEGLYPQLDECMACGEQTPLVALVPDEGGGLCQSCAPAVPGALRVPPAMMQQLIALPTIPSAQCEGASGALGEAAGGVLELLERSFEAGTGQRMPKRMAL